MAKAKGGLARLTYAGALEDRALLGALPAFQDLGTWRNWLVFLKAVEGLPLTWPEQQIFTKFTGRPYAPPMGGWADVLCITGRQSGKSRVVAAIQSVEALRATPERDGTRLYALAVAQDQRSSLRTLLAYSKSTFETAPMLQGIVTGSTTTTLSLSTGVDIAAYPCRPQAVRGLRARVAVLDEAAFYVSTDNRPLDREMIRAVRPCLATTGGRLLILSSPYAQSGSVWDMFQRHYGRASAVLVWKASAPEMNPTLGADYLQRMREDDPEAYATEVLGEFRAGVSSLFDPDALDATVARDVRERLPEPGRKYVGAADPSGGRHDAFVVAVAHAEGDRAVLDCVRAWTAPFDPSVVVAEAAALLKTYGLRAIVGDKYAAEFVSESFRKCDITYTPASRDRSQAYLDLLPLVNADRVRLLDDMAMLKEFRGLERMRGSSGRDRVDHRRGSSDDRANAAALALLEVKSASVPVGVPVGIDASDLGYMERGVSDWGFGRALQTERSGWFDLP